MKDLYVTITAIRYYYGVTPFKIGKKLKCIKENNNVYDSEAIKVVQKHIGTVGYIANSPNTCVTGTKSAGGLRSKVMKKFTVKVMFITSNSVICKVIDGIKTENSNYGNSEVVVSADESKKQSTEELEHETKTVISEN